MQPADTNRPGFQPSGCGYILPRALPWAGIRARRWRLRPSAVCGFWGRLQLRLFLKLTHYQFSLLGRSLGDGFGARRFGLGGIGFRLWLRLGDGSLRRGVEPRSEIVKRKVRWFRSAPRLHLLKKRG